MRTGAHVLQPVVHDIDQSAPRLIVAAGIIWRQQLVLMVIEIIPRVLTADTEVSSAGQDLGQRIGLPRSNALCLNIREPSAERRYAGPIRRNADARRELCQRVTGSPVAGQPGKHLLDVFAVDAG